MAAPRASGLEILEILTKAVSFLAIAYVIFKNKSWGRPAILACLVGSLAVEARAMSSSAFLAILSSLTLPVWYLYVWPNTTDYYRSLRESKDSGDPMGDLPIQPKGI